MKKTEKIKDAKAKIKEKAFDFLFKFLSISAVLFFYKGFSLKNILIFLAMLVCFDFIIFVFGRIYIFFAQKSEKIIEKVFFFFEFFPFLIVLLFIFAFRKIFSFFLKFLHFSFLDFFIIFIMYFIFNLILKMSFSFLRNSLKFKEII